jgi:hypothetical protein
VLQQRLVIQGAAQGGVAGKIHRADYIGVGKGQL